MSLSQSDLPHLKWSLLIFLLVLCAGATAIIASESVIAREQRQQQDAQNQLSVARELLATAQQDKVNMKDYTFEYDELVKRNIIGDDRRLDWIEGLEKIQQQHPVLDFKYTIAPQQPYIQPATLDSGNFDIKQSGMTLQFYLLHEAQLLDFFDTLRTNHMGWFSLDHCALERNADSHAIAQLKAECTGGWLTLQSRSAK